MRNPLYSSCQTKSIRVSRRVFQHNRASAVAFATSPHNKPDYHVEKHRQRLAQIGQLSAPAGRGLVLELGDGRHDPTPGRRAVMIAGERELVSSSGAFLERSLAVALEHQLRGPPDVDLGYHSAKMYGRGR